jgi:sarcosine oxidase, subunit alpha
MRWITSCGAVDAVPATTEDRIAAQAMADGNQTAGAGVDDFLESWEYTATRIRDHPVLGALGPAPMVSFTFDGATVEGRAGEPIAAALLAAGYRVLRTMPRFGDSRGGYCMIGRCADCLVVVDGEPNVPACVTPVAAGLDVRSQRGFGEHDVNSTTVNEP